MTEEELRALQEELADARAEVERLREHTADREARASHLESQLVELREELAQARSSAEEREATLSQQVRLSAERYREAVLASEPELPAELVTGASVEEIDASLERARETVARVRGHLESQAQAGRVPAGAPERSGPDLSALSAEEKIRLGLGRRAE